MGLKAYIAKLKRQKYMKTLTPEQQITYSLLGTIHRPSIDSEVPKPVQKPIVVPSVPKYTTPEQIKQLSIPEWFVVEGIAISPAEQLIIDALNLYRVEWHREVCFQGFKSSAFGHYRYDFYIPSKQLIIEYQGEAWHSTEDRILADLRKKEFCNSHGISIIYFDKRHYYNINSHISKLMIEFSIRKK